MNVPPIEADLADLSNQISTETNRAVAAEAPVAGLVTGVAALGDALDAEVARALAAEGSLGGGGDFLPLAGGVLSGDLILGGHTIADVSNLTSNGHQCVVVEDRELRRTDDSLSISWQDRILNGPGDQEVLNWGNRRLLGGSWSLEDGKITNAADPISNQDLATKNYVDIQNAGQTESINDLLSRISAAEAAIVDHEARIAALEAP